MTKKIVDGVELDWSPLDVDAIMHEMDTYEPKPHHETPEQYRARMEPIINPPKPPVVLKDPIMIEIRKYLDEFKGARNLIE